MVGSVGGSGYQTTGINAGTLPTPQMSQGFQNKLTALEQLTQQAQQIASQKGTNVQDELAKLVSAQQGATQSAASTQGTTQTYPRNQIYKRDNREYLTDSVGTEYEIHTGSKGEKYYIKDGAKWGVATKADAQNQYIYTDMAQAYNGNLAASAKNREVTNSDQQYTPELFMQLFMTELTHQDPTKPMENSAVIEQTSKIAELEQNTQMKEAFKTITESLKDSQSTNKAMMQTQTELLKTLQGISAGFQSLTGSMGVSSANTMLTAANLVGHTVQMKDHGFELKNGEQAHITLLFPRPLDLNVPGQPAKDGSPTHSVINIFNKQGKAVAAIDLNSMDTMQGRSGKVTFNWDGTDADGNKLPAGEYYGEAVYYGSDNQQYMVNTGDDIVTSVSFKNGKPLLNLLANGSKSIDDIERLI